MTREKAIKTLKELSECSYVGSYSGEDKEAFEMAISALSAEPCREADDYENEIADLHNRLDIALDDVELYKKEITDLEAETKGEWITKPNSALVHCSNCDFITLIKYKFCPNCGSDMRGGKK